MHERLSGIEQTFKNETLRNAVIQGKEDYERLSRGEKIETPKLVIGGNVIELDWKPIPDKEKYYNRYYQFLNQLGLGRRPHYVRIKSTGEPLALCIQESDLPSIKAQIAGFGLKALEESDYQIGFNACNLANVLNTKEVRNKLEKLGDEIKSQAPPGLAHKFVTMQIVRRERIVRERGKEKEEERVFYPGGYIGLLCNFSPVMFDRVRNVPFGQQEAILLFTIIDEVIAEATAYHTLTSLRERNKMIIRDIYGLDDGKPQTKEQLGRKFKLSPERIKEIKSGFLLNLQRPYFRKKILGFFENRVPLGSLPSELSSFSRT